MTGLSREEFLTNRQIWLDCRQSQDPSGRRRADAAINRIVQANLPLVHWVARKYNAPGVLYEDIVEEGTYGLIYATQEFKPELGTKFSTYAALWIRQKIVRMIENESRLIRVPTSQWGVKRKINHAISMLRLASDRDPTVVEIAEAMGLSQEQVLGLLELWQDPCSLLASPRAN